jgi:AcrR family transcriptional regulator
VRGDAAAADEILSDVGHAVSPVCNQMVGWKYSSRSARLCNQPVGNKLFGVWVRNPEATRRRLLEAGTAEFAAYGIAGARVERIAETSGCNKQSIYGHFGSKDGLFDAVFDAMVANVVDNVAFDTHDLPGYASRMFDWSRAHPEVHRLATWQQLERGGITEMSGAAAEVNAEKVAKLLDAQKAGVITQAIPAQYLLMLIYRLSTVQWDHARLEGKATESLRDAIVEAVRRLVAVASVP